MRSGRFADRREVVHAGLDALRDRDDALETWLRDDVLPVAKAMMADPSRVIAIDDVMNGIAQRRAKRKANG